ncbi:hypothetical protein NFI96_027941 [Prochilodus magdalenae]|nr:hypothetical protein NFI96_027941 [Prochilodus magdalenae]
MNCQRSVRQIRTVLDLWVKRLDPEDWSLLQSYWSGSAVPNEGDPFPSIGLTPDFKDTSGPLLDLNGLRGINLSTASGRALAKQSERGDDTDTDDGQLHSGWSMSSLEDTASSVYTADEIKAFLQRTKGQKLVQVTGCISDGSQFVHDVGHFRREKDFTELELYRMKKLLTRLRKNGTDGVHALVSYLPCWSEMDSPSKFFFGLEQKNGQKRFMYAVRTESGDLLSEPAEIRKRTVSFFSKLYNSEQSVAHEL